MCSIISLMFLFQDISLRWPWLTSHNLLKWNHLLWLRTNGIWGPKALRHGTWVYGAYLKVREKPHSLQVLCLSLPPKIMKICFKKDASTGGSTDYPRSVVRKLFPGCDASVFFYWSVSGWQVQICDPKTCTTLWVSHLLWLTGSFKSLSKQSTSSQMSTKKWQTRDLLWSLQHDF